MQIETIKVKQLKNWEKNPREISEDGLEALKKYLSKWGLLDPLLVDGRDRTTVLGGNMRLRAINQLGWDVVECNIVDVKNDDEALEVALISNNEFGSYIKDQLIGLVENVDIQLEDFQIDLKPVTLDSLIPKEVEEDDYEEPDEIETDIVLGDVFRLGDHRLMCGDSTKIEDVEKLMDGQKADMVFTDPPYGIAYEHDNRPADRPHKFDKLDNDDVDLEELLPDSFNNMSVVMKDGAVYYCWHSGKTQREFQNYLEQSGFIISTTIIWAKGHFAFSRQDYHPQHEPCFYGWKKGKAHQFYGERNNSTIWSVLYDSGNVTAGHDTIHPTQKPVELSVRAIKNSSKQDDIVLDLFGGSGSTLIACEQTDRKCYMMEIDPKYCEVICQRWEKLTNKERKKING